MILSRRIPSPAAPSTYSPSPAGPRCLKAVHIPRIRASDTGRSRSRYTTPAMPHTLLRSVAHGRADSKQEWRHAPPRLLTRHSVASTQQVRYGVALALDGSPERASLDRRNAGVDSVSVMTEPVVSGVGVTRM